MIVKKTKAKKNKNPGFHLFKVIWKHTDEMKRGLELEIGNMKGKKAKANSGLDL